MPEQFDINTVAAKVIDSNIDRLISLATGTAGTVSRALSNALRRTYKTYLDKSAQQYGMAKTFFIRGEPRPLYDYYVPLEIECGKTVLPNASVKNLENCTQRVVVTGTAGCGKSTLMRHFFLDSLKSSKRIPVFLELRQLNEQDEPDLISMLVRVLMRLGLDLEERIIVEALKNGRFMILFDGLDEVDEAIRPEVSRQIRRFSEESKEAFVVVSSRPEDQFAGWDGFWVFEAQPLSLNKAVQLVEKLPFDEETKTKFIRDLKRTLYVTHESFLSNPLLLSIMVMTYGQSASIPTKVSIFYNQAYEALFQTHDAYKGSFSRTRKTSLDIQQFEKLFAAFCLITYDSNLFEFSRIEALNRIDQAKRLSGIRVRSGDFLEDLLRAVSLLVADGLRLAFVHRSFQEYFAAKFVSTVTQSQKETLVTRLASRSRTDNVLSLFCELDQSSFEDVFLIPQIEKLRREIKISKKVGITHYTRYLKIVTCEISASKGPEGELSFFVHHKWREPEHEVLVCAVWAAFRRYKATEKHSKQDEKSRRRAYVELGRAKRRRILTENISSRSELVKDLSRTGGVFSIEFVQYLVDLPGNIRSERKESQHSLDEILGIIS